MREKSFSALPGFRLTMGFTLFYLSVLVLIPIVALFLRAFQMSWREFFEVVTADRAIAAYRLTFGASLIAAVANAAFGTVLAWVLVRYDFPGKRFIDALVDFPFFMPANAATLAAIAGAAVATRSASAAIGSSALEDSQA